MRGGTVPKNLFRKPVGKIRLCIPRLTSEGNIKMDLKIDGKSGLVAWIFLVQDGKELGDFVSKLLTYSQNLRIQNKKIREFVVQLTGLLSQETFVCIKLIYFPASALY